ncbi:MAG: PEP-CTERM sorting domain-containing protein [Verrucomicrobiota bacterium]
MKKSILTLALLVLGTLATYAQGYFFFANNSYSTNKIYAYEDTANGVATSSLKSNTVAHPYGSSLRISIYYGSGGGTNAPIYNDSRDVRAWNWNGANSGSLGITGTSLLAETSKGIIGFNSTLAGGLFTAGGTANLAYRTDSLQTSVKMQVRVWDSSAYGGCPTWESFKAKMDQGFVTAQWGMSTVWDQKLTDPNATPTVPAEKLTMPYFQLVPEPSSYALTVLGMGSMWFLRRKKQVS